jgi:hypothetical protein
VPQRIGRDSEARDCKAAPEVEFTAPKSVSADLSLEGRAVEQFPHLDDALAIEAKEEHVLNTDGPYAGGPLQVPPVRASERCVGGGVVTVSDDRVHIEAG